MTQLPEPNFIERDPDVVTKEWIAAYEEKEFCGCIEFVSLQDLKGSLYFGGQYDKLREICGLKHIQ